MPFIQGSPGEVHELARYEVRPEALDQCIATIHEFVAYVRANESGALRYEVWQESERPTRFVHIFVWRGTAEVCIPHDRSGRECVRDSLVVNSLASCAGAASIP